MTLPPTFKANNNRPCSDPAEPSDGPNPSHSSPSFPSSPQVSLLDFHQSVSTDSLHLFDLLMGQPAFQASSTADQMISSFPSMVEDRRALCDILEDALALVEDFERLDQSLFRGREHSHGNPVDDLDANNWSRSSLLSPSSSFSSLSDDWLTWSPRPSTKRGLNGAGAARQ